MSRRYDAWGFGMVKELSTILSNPCFECGELTHGRHHVVPVSRGGTKQLPLCGKCHSKAHGIRGNGFAFNGDLIREGMYRARERGAVLGAPRVLTPKIVEAIKALRAQGLSIHSVSQKVGVSVGSVHSIVKRL